jgi:hypothetical protein
VAGAFRSLMQSRDEEPRAGAVRTLVPVNVRTGNTRHVMDDRLSSMLLDRPVELDEPVERLRAVHERIAALRARHEVEAGASLFALAGQEPFAAVSFLIQAGPTTSRRPSPTRSHGWGRPHGLDRLFRHPQGRRRGRADERS